MELFAGVGGFRLGLEGLGTPSHPRNAGYRVVWSNQWEPSTKRQHASEVYTSRWGSEGHNNEDIFAVVSDPAKFAEVVSATPDILVGGFPCQDYSVAKPAEMAAGIEGKKGVLWWAIQRSLKQLQEAGHPVKYLILENVDRLLKSPTANRGRDLAIILASLAELGYAVEWRVVDASDYGYPQRRKRVFLVGYHSSTATYCSAHNAATSGRAENWLSNDGVLAHALPASPGTESGKKRRSELSSFDIGRNPLDAQAQYAAAAKGVSRFCSAGLMVNGTVWTVNMEPAATTVSKAGMARTLGEVVAKTLDVPPEFFLEEDEVSQWKYLKGAKSAIRTTPAGFEYKYSEGPMTFPDSLDRASRTIITAEGGRSPSRFKHVIESSNGRLRRLVPEELEELNGFPREFTKLTGVTDTKRAFLMGNALVVGVVQAIGASLAVEHSERNGSL